MIKNVKKLFNDHIVFLCACIVATSFVALFLINTETFYATTTSVVSVLAPEFDFNTKLNSLINTNKTVNTQVIRDEFLLKVANEHIPIIMCGFYDLITGSKRLQKPDNIEEGRWLQIIWAELMEDMGIPAECYMSIMELRYSWFTETKDSFETFQSKLEPNFVKATLERYIKVKGNFVPTSVDKYNKALSCKLYRVFTKSASLLDYMGSTKASTQPSSQESSQPTKQETSSSPKNQDTKDETKKDETKTENKQLDTNAKKDDTKLVETSTVKWIVPSNFTEMCLDKDNRLQCFLMSTLIVIAIVAVIAIVISLVAPIFANKQQPQF